MPGDIAIGDPEGVTFVPPQLAEKLADETAMDHLIDEWPREGKYTPGQVDAKWAPKMIEEFNAWLEKRGSKTPLAAALSRWRWCVFALKSRNSAERTQEVLGYQQAHRHGNSSCPFSSQSAIGFCWGRGDFTVGPRSASVLRSRTPAAMLSKLP